MSHTDFVVLCTHNNLVVNWERVGLKAHPIITHKKMLAIII